MVRESTIDWPSEAVLSRNINSCSNRTIAFFWNQFPKGHPIRPVERRNPPRNPRSTKLGN